MFILSARSVVKRETAAIRSGVTVVNTDDSSAVKRETVTCPPECPREGE
jgi:hypothetical protein